MAVRILYLITSLNIGGTELHLLELVKYFKSKYNISVGYIKEFGPIGERIKNLGVSVIYFDSFLKLYTFIKREKINFIHSLLYRANIIGRVSGKIASVPIIISSQRSIDRWKKFYHVFLDSITASFTDRIIANSQKAREILIKREGISPDKISVVYNGIGNLDVPSDLLVLRNKLNISKNQIIVGTVTRIHREKGTEYILETSKLILEKRKDIKIIIVGDGPEKENLKLKVKSLKLEDKITFTGWRDDISSILSIMDIFFLSSEEESFPQAILEAMYLGKPVIATDVGGVNEIIKNNLTGILVPPKKPDELANMVLYLLENKEIREKMEKNGKEFANKFTLSKMLEETDKIYTELINKKLVRH